MAAKPRQDEPANAQAALAVWRRRIAVKHAAYRLSGEFASPDDIQVLLLKILCNPAEIEHPVGLAIRMLANQLLDSRRIRRGRHALWPTVEVLFTDLELLDPFTVTAHKSQLDVLRRLFEELPHRNAEIFLLQRVEGLRHPAIAPHFGISVSMVEKIQRTTRVWFSREFPDGFDPIQPQAIYWSESGEDEVDEDGDFWNWEGAVEAAGIWAEGKGTGGDG